MHDSALWQNGLTAVSESEDHRIESRLGLSLKTELYQFGIFQSDIVWSMILI